MKKYILYSVIIGITIFAIITFSRNNQKNMNTNTPISISTLDQTLLEHRVATQITRWYQYYEENTSLRENQFDILDENIAISSLNAASNGIIEYIDYIESIPTTWKNSHHIQEMNIVENDNHIDLELDIIYQNIGMQEGSAVTSLPLHYSAKLKNIEGQILPIFTDITITKKEADIPTEFKNTFIDSYAENRSKSIMHYWLSIIEQNDGNAEPFKEILAEKFILNFPTGPITDYSDLQNWFQGASSQIEKSSHTIEKFNVDLVDENTFSLSAEFDWKGLTVGGDSMTARTGHRWVIIDNSTERFARIEKMEVEILEPFKIIE